MDVLGCVAPGEDRALGEGEGRGVGGGGVFFSARVESAVTVKSFLAVPAMPARLMATCVSGRVAE